ncbi:ERF family protein [Paraburkholderia dilworthii]|uniref:ERF family protein n=1 Tax=Paraburkholderia dilworthii TaxID=948106 RepID=UPI0004245A47|nr:ERF family protein [Paraburkholderia dilworthii]
MNTATMADITDIEIATPATAKPPAVQQTRAVTASATPADLLRIAVESGADLDRLERLMALQEKWEAGEARKAYVVAMTAFKAEPLEIFKKKTVEFSGTKYSHAELSDVTEVVCPAMAKHQLSHRWDVTQNADRITVDCVITHVLGHSEKVTMEAMPDSSGKKNAIQQVASTISYLQRYTLLAATGVATKGMDDDAQSSIAKVDTDEVWMKWEGALNSAETAEDVRKVRALAGTAFETIGDVESWNQFKVMADKKKAELGRSAQ